MRKAKGILPPDGRKRHSPASKKLLQAKGPPFAIFSGYTDPDQIPDEDCDLSGFDLELIRAYEEWADDYFGQLWRAIEDHFGLEHTPDPTVSDSPIF